jgi:nicotinamidase-related amidase
MSAPALMLIDVQYAIDDPKWGRRGQPDAEVAMASLLAAWRKAKWPVIHVRHDSADPNSSYHTHSKGHPFKAEVMPLASETVLPKQTNSAFIGTDLAAHLERLGTNKIVVGGVLLENSVEATVRMAGNLGYDVIVAEDAVASIDRVDRAGNHWTAEQVHALTLALLDGEYAAISNSKSIIGSMS